MMVSVCQWNNYSFILFCTLVRSTFTQKVMTYISQNSANWLTLCMFSEVIALEVLALVKKTHTPVSATSLPSVTNTLHFLLRPGCWATSWDGVEAAGAAAAAEQRSGHRNNSRYHHNQRWLLSVILMLGHLSFELNNDWFWRHYQLQCSCDCHWHRDKTKKPCVANN